MTQAWVILTDPDGRDIAAPSDQQLEHALAQVFSGAVHDPEGGRASACLRFGYDDGLMYELEVAGGGEAKFEEWSDRDCEIALASPRRISVSQAEALQLWLWLSQRQVAKIRSQPWHSGA